jgi:hypothetical protein
MHFRYKRTQSIPERKQFPFHRLDPVRIQTGIEAELVVNGETRNNGQRIDRTMSWSILEAVGEQLQQSLRPEPSRLPPHLQNLMDELRRRDNLERSN